MSTKTEKKPTKIGFMILVGLLFTFFLINLSRTFGLNAPSVFASDYGNKLDISFDIYQDGEFLEKSTLPYSFESSTKDKEIELITTLPSDDFINKSFISFRTSGYSVRIEVEGQEIYSFFEDGRTDYGGAYWHFVKLPDNSSSKQIIIKLICPTSDPFSHNLFPIYIGSKGYLLVQNFGQTFESLFFGITLIIFGFVFLGNIVFFNRKVGNLYLFSLSLLLICFGCWVITQSPAKQLLGITNPAAPMEFSFFSMFALPFCIWFYVSTNYKKIGEFKIIKYFAFSILFIYIPISILAIIGVPYTCFLSLIGGLILLFSLLVLGISFKLYFLGEKTLISCNLAILSILLSIIVEEVLLILKINIGNVSVLHAGMGLAAIIFIYKSIGNLIEKNTEENQEKLLKKLAYLDVVTLAENRNSYERFLENEGQQVDGLGVILADVNGLKMTNDLNGHKCGDELLKKLSKKLKDNLPNDSKLFRVGGDEFVGIIKTNSEKEFLDFVEDLKIQFNPTADDCGMAIGEHFYLKNKDKSLAKAIEKADKKMYRHKEIQKLLIHESFLVNGFHR
jgi:diguanylate cyclase (GGDEF)-like protein